VGSLDKYVAALSNLSQAAAVHLMKLEVAIHNTIVQVKHVLLALLLQPINQHALLAPQECTKIRTATSNPVAKVTVLLDLLSHPIKQHAPYALQGSTKIRINSQTV
jgi:hypothetical protein